MKRLITCASVVIVSAVATIAMPMGSALAASGGGCANSSYGGVTIRSCISAAGGGYVTADYYVDAKTSACTYVNPYVVTNGSTSFKGANSCALGHHVIGQYYVGPGNNAFTRIDAQTGPARADSPVISGF